MKILENKSINIQNYGINSSTSVFFLRIDPEDLSLALQDILNELADFSWLNHFNKDYLQESMRINSQKTCDALKAKFYDETDSPIIEEAGEYIVSVYSKRGLVEGLNHLDVPLAELIGRKKVGNPGFDFFTEESSIQLVTCGEAKYQKGKNAYNASLTQINDFIKDQKHKSDVVILTHLVSDTSLSNLIHDHFGVCAAFSSTNINSDTLIQNICQNKEFQDILCHNFVFLVAVNII